jgi:hypothetical protein
MGGEAVGLLASQDVGAAEEADFSWGGSGGAEGIGYDQGVEPFHDVGELGAGGAEVQEVDPGRQVVLGFEMTEDVGTGGVVAHEDAAESDHCRPGSDHLNLLPKAP